MANKQYHEKTALMREPSAVQNYLLDQYRLTDEYRRIYGEQVIKNNPEGNTVRAALNAIEKYGNVEHADLEHHKALVIDLIYSRFVLNFSHWEYFSYELENRTIEQRLEFLPQESRDTFFKALYAKASSKGKNDLPKLRDKYRTYEMFKPYFKRDIINVNKDSERGELEDFCRKHSRFMVKPATGSLGKGIRIINVGDYESTDAIYDELIAEKNGAICEELIEQHETMAAIHPQSCNSVRIFTYLKDNKDVNIVCAWLKAGVGDAFVDNGGSGGIIAAIDHETGMVCSDAADESNHNFAKHPDTGFVFKGFRILQWNELINMVTDMARALPGAILVGWDVALSKDKGWQLIEGNGKGHINLIQIPLKVGLRAKLQNAIEWDENRKYFKGTSKDTAKKKK